MDGKEDKISDHFANIYENLYNSVNDDDDLNIIKDEVEKKISYSSIDDIEKVTPKIVKDAICHLNPGKSDPTYSFSSDCLINAPDILSEQM